MISTVDPAQHGHVAAAGPTSHEDAEIVAGCMQAMKDWVETCMRVVLTSQPPAGWNSDLFASVVRRYDGPSTAPVQHPELAIASASASASTLASLPPPLPAAPATDLSMRRIRDAAKKTALAKKSNTAQVAEAAAKAAANAAMEDVRVREALGRLAQQKGEDVEGAVRALTAAAPAVAAPAVVAPAPAAPAPAPAVAATAVPPPAAAAAATPPACAPVPFESKTFTSKAELVEILRNIPGGSTVPITLTLAA